MTHTNKINWTCDTCHNAITTQPGYVHIRHDDVKDAQASYDELAHHTQCRVANIAEFLDFTREAKWQTHHAHCDPHPYTADYIIDTTRIQTHADLLKITAHLMGKGWLRFTNWVEVIENAANQATGQ